MDVLCNCFQGILNQDGSRAGNQDGSRGESGSDNSGAYGLKVDGTNVTLKGTVFMISGCQDDQTSADVSNTKSFQLPAHSGPGKY